MTVYLVNPSHVSFGIGVITPRWLYVLASATPTEYGDPRLVDETLEPFDTTAINAGDVVGIGVHTGNALRGDEIGTAARARGAYVVFGGIHATLYPDEARDLGGAHAVVTGDGERVWPLVLRDCATGENTHFWTKSHGGAFGRCCHLLGTGGDRTVGGVNPDSRRRAASLPAVLTH